MRGLGAQIKKTNEASVNVVRKKVSLGPVMDVLIQLTIPSVVVFSDLTWELTPYIEEPVGVLRRSHDC